MRVVNEIIERQGRIDMLKSAHIYELVAMRALPKRTVNTERKK